MSKGQDIASMIQDAAKDVPKEVLDLFATASEAFLTNCFSRNVNPVVAGLTCAFYMHTVAEKMRQAMLDMMVAINEAVADGASAEEAAEKVANKIMGGTQNDA